MSHKQDIHIAAGGHGTRIREEMVRLGLPEDLPKHLLPTGAEDGETLLGRIVRQALAAPNIGKVIIHANTSNALQFIEHPDVSRAAEVHVGHYGDSLGPFTQPLVETRERTLGCAGDFYADFSWESFIKQHESTRFPVSFLVGHTVAVDGGAAFDVAEDGQITSFRRADRTAETEPINIGAYIFEPDEAVLDIVKEVSAADIGDKREDVLVRKLVGSGLIGAICVEGTPYNINTPETYQALLDHTAQASFAT